MDGIPMNQWRLFETGVRKLVEGHYRTTFSIGSSVAIHGKIKRFDFVDTGNYIAGDSKYYSFTKSGLRPSAKFSIINEYIWLLQKLDPQWRKFLVIGPDEHLVLEYVREFDPWLDSVTVFYSDGAELLKKIR